MARPFSDPPQDAPSESRLTKRKRLGKAVYINAEKATQKRNAEKDAEKVPGTDIITLKSSNIVLFRVFRT